MKGKLKGAEESKQEGHTGTAKETSKLRVHTHTQTFSATTDASHAHVGKREYLFPALFLSVISLFLLFFGSDTHSNSSLSSLSLCTISITVSHFSSK